MEKLKKLKDISDEVGVLHPLLMDLFRKVDGIHAVEYTHGSREFGVDVLLTSDATVLGDQEYIGVIAKVGGITQGSHDVDRQIDQCIVMPRITQGKRQIYVGEIWVVTSGNISANAEELFHRKYHNHKIKFISGERLLELIDKFYPEYWNNIPSEIGRSLSQTKSYLEAIEKSSSFSVSNLDGYELSQELIRIEGDGYSKLKKGPVRSSSRTTMDHLLSKQGTVLIEGGMGSGKSHLLRRTAISLCDPAKYEEGKSAPLYSTLRDLDANNSGSIIDLINSRIGDNSYANGSRVIVFIDGLDEAKSSQTERVELLRKLHAEVLPFPGIKLIVAGRELGDLTRAAPDLSRALHRYEMAPLSLNQVITLIEKACVSVSVKGKISDDLRRSLLYKMLPRTPIAAVLLTRLLQENSKEVPSNLTELYAKYSELALGRWDHEKGIQSEKEYETARKVVVEISTFMLNNNIQVISVDEALGFFETYLNKRNLDINAKALFGKVCDRCDLVACDFERGTFSFRHRSFSEFFYAQGMISSSGDRAPRISENCFDLYWASTTYFWTGIIKDSPKHIEELSRTPTSSDKTALVKMTNMGNILLAAHQTPYDSISLALKNTFIEAAHFFLKLKSGSMDSPLRRFPEMTLLCIFRYLMSESFGYEFFRGAIETSMIEILDDPLIDQQARIYALFFLSTCSISIDAKDVFDDFVNKVGVDKLPLSIQFAIRHEALEHRLSGDGVSRVYKRIRRFSREHYYKSQVERLYELPIDKL